MHPNYDDTRHLLLTNTLNALSQQHTPEEMKMVEPLIKEYIANTVTDEFLFQDFQRMAAEKRAKDLTAAEQYAEDQERQKAAAVVAKGHSDRLATANKKATTYSERAEAAESKAKGLEAQLEGLWKGQGRR
jgi:hypothetical protein